MEALFKKNSHAFVRGMREIEMEMLEDYEDEYGEEAYRLYSAQALRLLIEVFSFAKKMIPYYRSTHKMLEQLAFVGETGECRYLTGVTGDMGFSFLMLNKLEERQRKKTVQYAARWLEYYYRVYEKAKQEEKGHKKVQMQLDKINEMVSGKLDAGMYPPKAEGAMDKDVQYPIRLYKHLDDYVVGQDEVKKTIAMAVHHYVNYKERSNVLMIGPSGSGKNYVMKILSEFEELDDEMTVYVHDSSGLTPSGFQGNSVEDIFKEFANVCRATGKSLKKGIIYLDEIDKIIYPNTDSHNENMNATVQRQLLAALEGTTVIAGVNTANILFILGGAFETLYDMEAERAKKKQNKVGFRLEEEKEGGIPMKDCNLKEDILALGAQKEFLARIPVIVRMERLGKEELKKILLHEKTGIIKQKQKIFAKDGLELVVEEAVYDLLAQMMYEENLGARSARNIVENILKNYNFDMLFHGYKKMTIHEGVIRNNEKPYFERGDEGGKKSERNVGTLHRRMERLAV